MNKKIILILLITVLFSVCVCGIVLAENLEDLQNKKNDLQNQINESNELIEEIKIELTENLEQLNNINEKIYAYESEITVLESDLEVVENNIEVVTEKLTVVEENYKLQQNAFENRMVAMYEAGDIVYLDVLLNSNSISDFIYNYYLIGEITKYDNQLLQDIENQRIQIEDIKKILEEKLTNIEIIKKNKERTTIALENAKVIRNSYINKLTEQEMQTQIKIDEFQAELNSIESQIVELTTGKIGSDYIGGEFAWPAPGYTTVTSNFGMRLHPIFKVNRLHTGTDIGMPTGAAIVAANDGVVIKSTYTTGYGNMIMVDHGGGVATVYGHGSENIAQTGQTVKRGDIIMKAGSTGWSTGPHLHFEIRINGNYVDPLPYITSKAKIEGTEKTEETEGTEENGGEKQ